MTFELAACILLALVSLPVSKSIAFHYIGMTGLNFLFLGYEYADSSLLAISFGVMAAFDIWLFILGARIVLMFSAALMIALCFESIGNGDWLLTHSMYLSIATNALIIGSLVKEYFAWMHGKSEHS